MKGAFSVKNHTNSGAILRSLQVAHLRSIKVVKMSRQDFDKAFKNAHTFCLPHLNAKTWQDFKIAAKEWSKLDRGGMTSQISFAVLRCLERRAMGADEAYMHSEVDKVAFG